MGYDMLICGVNDGKDSQKNVKISMQTRLRGRERSSRKVA